mgnify:CR=1 FL=1
MPSIEDAYTELKTKIKKRAKLLIFMTNVKKIDKYSTRILAVATVVLIVVTGLLIIVTYNLTTITSSLLTWNEKEKIQNQISLAEDLNLETSQNKEFLKYILSNLESLKNKTEYQPDLLKTTTLQQAKDLIGFGSLEIRSKLDYHLDGINLIKDDLQEIKTASIYGDLKIKKERIDRAIKIANSFINSNEKDYNIDEFLKYISDYIKERYIIYNEIDKKLEGKIRQTT